MCDPISIALTVGSQLAKSYFEGQAQKKVNRARTATVQANIADQKKYQAAAQQALNTSQQASGRPAIDQATQDAAAANTAAYQSSINPGQLLPGQGDTSAAVKQAIVGALSSGVTSAKDAAARKALLDAYGQATFGRDVAVNRAGQEIATQGNFMQGRSALMPIQLEQANRAGDSSSRMAGLVSGLGSIASGAYGAYTPTSAATPAGWVDWNGGGSTYYG